MRWYWFAMLMLLGCGESPDSAAPVHAEEPATVEHKTFGEADLTTITLTPEAEERLGVATSAAAVKPVRKRYSVAGEIVLPAGQTVVVGAPVAGHVVMTPSSPAPGGLVEKGQVTMRIAPLLPAQRDLRANAQAAVAAAQTRLEAAKLRARRAAKMLEDGVGSARAKEDADEAVQLEETALDAARARLRQLESTPVDAEAAIDVQASQGGILRELHVGNGQMVAAGAQLFEVTKLDPVWVKVPVYAGDVGALERTAAAQITALNAPSSERGVRAAPVSAPPTADPFAATTDLYYRLGNANGTYRPGQKVSVNLAMRGKRECLQAPYAAILYDMSGGTWVYEKVDPHVYARRRVMVESIAGEVACIAQGLSEGAEVVTDAAAELFGTEFGGGH